MLKFGGLSFAALALMAIHAPANAVILGPAAASCSNGDRAVLVNVVGLKANTGRLRVQLYNATSNFLDKGVYLERVDVAVPSSGDAAICVPVPRTGNYVVSVRHDRNGNGRADMKDGGGFSGNPDMSLGDLIAKRKPNLAQSTIRVGNATKRINVVLSYVRGLSFQPI